MQEKIFDVDIIYIQNVSGTDFQIECISRRSKNTILNISKVEGIELTAKKPAEIKNSYLQFGENEKSVWNIRFAFPVNIVVTALSKIIIEII